MKLFVGAVLYFSFVYGQTSIPEEEETETVFQSVDAVLSRSATLPCDIEPDIKEDRVYMVLWYRDGHSRPIYSFDVRGRAFNKALHWSDSKMFGPRAYFVTVSRPAALTLDGVQLDDEGVYRCRVDFKVSPTRNFAINLTVIVPPHQLLIYDNSGRDVNHTVGPLEEKTDLVLTCEVRGGRPTPTVSWFMNERLIEGHVEEIGNHMMVNKLKISGVTRDHLNSTYKCQASNTKLMMPSEKTVRLELLLRPLSVNIINKPRELVANEEVSIQCEVEGSRPKALVSWSRDNRPFRRGRVNAQENETSVLTTITFVPVPEDDNSVFKCVGENPKLTGVGLEDSFKLNVVYPPQVVLHLGNTLNPEDIKEGDDVYFECSIKANPKQHRILWYHEGLPVNQNMSSGVIISTHSLVLQKVTRYQSGSYTCLAANVRGETMSEIVNLRVRYAPVCSRDTDVTVIGASLDEIITVRCQVSADPSDVTFVWQFNNSGESFDVSPARFATSSGNVSELMYTPSSQRDYGTLTCQGSNKIGRQLEPCIFQVVPASKPNPLTNCTVRSANNQSTDSVVEVECRAGYDGGLPQRFVLEAYDARSMRLRLNRTTFDTESPTFRLDIGELLPSPPSLRIVVYAENSKGKSEKIVMDDILLNDAEKRTDGSGGVSLVPLAGLLTGCLLTLGLAVLVVVVVAVRRKRECDGCSRHINIDAASKTSSKSRRGSMLEINTGDNRYVVAYTLKPVSDCGASPDAVRQPDILNTPRGTEPTPNILPRPEHFYKTSDATNKQSPSSCDSSTNTLSRTRPRPRDQSFTTTRRDHIIADSIPGPESCV
ncbi:hemicentin-1-like isoform X2 [Diorhabda carinulata]|uniref:hemicentin-1-like isoform X2 n=1 Tax=Diorhabda carinulata TaxID=1163345 RepID=UPI0025A027EE|nr:hemicentin-1-like isoform X2 [Diorhabda carinulata]